MRPPAKNAAALHAPELLPKATILAEYLQTLSASQLAKIMHISPKLAGTTKALFSGWTNEPSEQRVAIDSFIGDIYSGLQVPDWTDKDRVYANKTLRILSGLYGILRPLDGIYPYRLEMGYKLPAKRFSNLYTYWGDAIAKTLPADGPIINLAAVEYSKTVTDYVNKDRIVTPSFLTLNPKTHEPTFVVVHAKIARGAFARWLIVNQVDDVSQLKNFTDLGYAYNARLSSPEMPVFVCTDFGGIGLSIRLS